MRFLRVAGFALGAVAVAGVAVVVTASASGMSFGVRPSGSSTPSGADLASLQARSSSAACTAFVQHFATEIGKSPAQVNAAFQKAIADTLADEVKSGKLTQAQADAIKQKLASQAPCALPGVIGRPGTKGAITAYLQQYMAAAASALGVTESELKADLASGQSLSQVAAARHVSESDFRTKLIANLKPALDQAVTNGKLTSAQEQMVLKRLQTGPLPLWSAPAARHKPGASPTPSAA